MQVSDDLYLGPVQVKMDGGMTPTKQDVGVGPLGRVYIFDVVPLTLNTTGLATAQAVGAAGNLTLTAGTGVTGGVADPDGGNYTVLKLDTPRCIDVVSSNVGDTTQTATFYGYDQYGQGMSQTVTLNGTTRVATTKAFLYVSRIAVSAATAGNISAGTTDTLGLPLRMLTKDYTVSCTYNLTAVALSAITAADATSPATTATGDVRGRIALPSASDGSKRLVFAIAVPAIACGPNATRIGALGVTQA